MASNNATPSVGVFVGENKIGHSSTICSRISRRTTMFRFTGPRPTNTPLLHGRLNRWALNHQITSILKSSDVAFFEWASDLLEIATHMPKYCPIVTRLHSFELHAWGGRINWDHVDRVVFVSEAMRRNFIELYPSHAGKTAEVYNGIRLDKFQPHTRKGGLNLGMLCSLLPRKRVYEAILSFAKLREQGVDATLHIAGGRIHGPGHDEYYVVCHKVVEDLG
ncbi:MAG: glycosyltransferase [Acidobacteriota bacterium]